MQTLFLSDLHLGEKTPHIFKEFCLFADYCKENHNNIEAIYYLGDFFELWIGDDFQSEAVDAVIAQLKSISDLGIDCYFMHGNRDFLVGSEFCEKAGLNLIPDPYRVNLNGKSVILSHGDSLCIDDIGYQELRKTFRNPKWQQEFLSQSLEQRFETAMQVREQSMQSHQDKKAQNKDQEYIEDVNHEAVCEFLTRMESLCLIHGHTHRPDLHEFEIYGQKASRIVLAAWYSKGSFLSYESGEFETIELS